MCKEYNVTDYYLDSCIFDLMATGDKSFRVAALAAQRDLGDVSAATISASPSIALLLVALFLLSGTWWAER